MPRAKHDAELDRVFSQDFMTVGINKDRHARILIMRPEITLHSEAGYIFADCSR